MREVMKNVSDPNERISYLRSGVIGRLVEVASDAFVENEEKILTGMLFRCRQARQRNVPDIPAPVPRTPSHNITGRTMRRLT